MRPYDQEDPFADRPAHGGYPDPDPDIESARRIRRINRIDQLNRRAAEVFEGNVEQLIYCTTRTGDRPVLVLAATDELEIERAAWGLA